MFAIYLKLKITRILYFYLLTGDSSPSFVGQRLLLALPTSEHIMKMVYEMVIVMICCVTERGIFQFQVVTIDDAHCFLSHLVLGLYF